MFFAYWIERTVQSHIITRNLMPKKIYIPKFLILQWIAVLANSPQLRTALIHIFYNSAPFYNSDQRGYPFKPVLEKLKQTNIVCLKDRFGLWYRPTSSWDFLYFLFPSSLFLCTCLYNTCSQRCGALWRVCVSAGWVCPSSWAVHEALLGRQL